MENITNIEKHLERAFSQESKEGSELSRALLQAEGYIDGLLDFRQKPVEELMACLSTYYYHPKAKRMMQGLSSLYSYCTDSKPFSPVYLPKVVREKVPDLGKVALPSGYGDNFGRTNRVYDPVACWIHAYHTNKINDPSFKKPEREAVRELKKLFLPARSNDEKMI